MPFYASQYSGDGTESNPYHPTITEYITGPWQGIDLRPDATVASGWSLVWSQNAASQTPGGTMLITSNPGSSLTNPQINAINNALGTSLPSGSTLRQAAKAIMTTEATGHQNGKWNRLTAGNDGKLRIFLGDLVEEWDEEF